MDTSHIRITEFRNTVGKTERVEYSWQGKSPMVDVSWEFLSESPHLQEGNLLKIGPYKLRCVEASPLYFTFVRVDYPFWRLVAGWYKGNRLLDLAYRRFIITLAVWGLADYHQSLIPSWRDIKIVKWFGSRSSKRTL